MKRFRPWERTHPACRELETLSTLEACAPRDDLRVLRLTAQRRVQDSFPHLFGIQIRFHDLARGAAMPAIAGVDGLKTLGRLLKRLETKHSSSVGQERAGPGVLHHNGFAARQVAHSS